jgi:cytoskeletal protein RodZ
MTSMTDVVVRRRGGLMAAVASVATVVAVGYLWAYAAEGGALRLVVGTLVGLVAVAHAVAWRAAATPLLVADETGVRIRLGSAWTGIPWEAVDQVEVQQRGRVRDGHVAVLLPEGSDALAGAGLRSRLAAWGNHMFFEAPLVVPFGLTTTMSTVDPVAAMRRLADGRAVVIDLDSDEDEAEHTVEILRRKSAAPGDAHRSDPAAVDASVPGSAAPSAAEPGSASPGRVVLPLLRRLGARTTRTDPDTPAPTMPTAGLSAPAEAASAPVEAASPPAVAAAAPPASPVVSVPTRPARREEVTIAAAAVPATDGGLALAPDHDDVEPAVALPEIEQLRRSPASDRPGGNVGLIIDATTDLSARAMQRVRERSSVPESEVRIVGERTDPPGEVLGHRLAEARTRLGLDVDEVADRTRIRPYVIESIEHDDFAACGGDFYARGHLRQLARVLGIDAEPLVATYNESFASSEITPREVFEVELSSGTTGMVRGGERGANWGALVGAVLVLLIVWGVARSFVDSSAPEEVAPDTNNAGISSPGPGNPAPPPPVEASVKVTAVGGDADVVVLDRFKQKVFSGVIEDGKSRRIDAEAPLRVKTDDGSLVELRYGGKDRGPMGPAGEPAKQLVRGHR